MNKYQIPIAVNLVLCALCLCVAYFAPPLLVLLIPLFAAKSAWSFLAGGTAGVALWFVTIAGSFWQATDNLAVSLGAAVILLVGGLILARQTASGALLKHKILTAGGTVAFLALYFLLPLFKQIDAGTLQEIGESIKESVVFAFKTAYAESGQNVLSTSDIQNLAENMIDAAYKLLPYVLLALSAVVGYITLWLLHGILKLYGALIAPPSFSALKSGPVTVLIAVVSLVAIMAFKDGVLSIVFTNIYAITTFLLSMCGISLVDWFLKQRGLKTFIRLFLLLIIYLLTSNVIGTALLCLAAAVDAHMNFRGLNS